MSLKSTVEPFSSSLQASVRPNIGPYPSATLAREPITPSKGLVRTQFPSTKMGRMIACESQLEHKAALHFEFSPAVRRFREQPVKFEYDFLGSTRRYTPDFELTFYTGEIWYVEIKPANKMLCEDRKLQFSFIETAFEDKGLNFIILTDEDLDHPVRLRNLSLLRMHQRVKPSKTAIQDVTALLNSNEPTTVGSLVGGVKSAAVVLSLIANHQVSVDLDMPITHSTFVSLPKENNNETCLFTY